MRDRERGRDVDTHTHTHIIIFVFLISQFVCKHYPIFLTSSTSFYPIIWMSCRPVSLVYVSREPSLYSSSLLSFFFTLYHSLSLIPSHPNINGFSTSLFDRLSLCLFFWFFVIFSLAVSLSLSLSHSLFPSAPSFLHPSSPPLPLPSSYLPWFAKATTQRVEISGIEDRSFRAKKKKAMELWKVSQPLLIPLIISQSIRDWVSEWILVVIYLDSYQSSLLSFKSCASITLSLFLFLSLSLSLSHFVYHYLSYLPSFSPNIFSYCLSLSFLGRDSWWRGCP